MKQWQAANSGKRLSVYAGLRLFLVLTLALFLSACGSSRPAPVVEIGGAPMFINQGRMHRVNAGETVYAVAWMYDLDFLALARANNLQEPYTLTTGQLLRVDLRSTPQVANAAPSVAPPSDGVRVNAVTTTGGTSRSPIGSGGLQRTPLPESEPAGGGTARTTLPPLDLPPAGEVPAAPPVAIQETPAPAPAPEPAPVVVTPPPQVAPAPSTPPPAPPSPAADAPINWAWPSAGQLIGRFSESDIDGKGLKFAGRRGDPVLAAADGQVVYAGRGLLRYGDLIIIKHNDRFLSAYAHNDRILVQEGAFVARGEKIAELGSSGIDREMLHFEIRVEGQPEDPMRFLPPR